MKQNYTRKSKLPFKTAHLSSLPVELTSVIIVESYIASLWTHPSMQEVVSFKPYSCIALRFRSTGLYIRQGLKDPSSSMGTVRWSCSSFDKFGPTCRIQSVLQWWLVLALLKRTLAKWKGSMRFGKHSAKRRTFWKTPKPPMASRISPKSTMVIDRKHRRVFTA